MFPLCAAQFTVPEGVQAGGDSERLTGAENGKDSIGRKRRRTVSGGNETTLRASFTGGLFVPCKCRLELCFFHRRRVGWGQTSIRPYTFHSDYSNAEVSS